MQSTGARRAVLSQGEPRDAAVNFDTYRNLQRHLLNYHIPTRYLRSSNTVSVWLGGPVVRSDYLGLVTQRSRVRVPPGTLSSNNLEQVIYTRGAQANSAFHPSGVGK